MVRAFRLAAEKKWVDEVWLLVEAGAKFYNLNLYKIKIDEDYEFCPICLKKIRNEDDEIDYCNHWITFYSQGQYYWMAENKKIGEDVKELAKVVGKSNIKNEDFERIIWAAPEELLSLFVDARLNKDFYWTKKKGIYEVAFETHNIFGDSGSDYFHPEEDYALTIKNEAKAGLEWLRGNYPEVLIEKDNAYGAYDDAEE